MLLKCHHWGAFLRFISILSIAIRVGSSASSDVYKGQVGEDRVRCNKQHLLQTSRLHVWNVAGLSFNRNPHMHDLCVGGATAHSLLLDLGLHCHRTTRSPLLILGLMLAHPWLGRKAIPLFVSKVIVVALSQAILFGFDDCLSPAVLHQHKTYKCC